MVIHEKYLASPTFDDMQELMHVLLEGQLSGTGNAVKSYEKLLAERFQRACVVTNSGSAAIETALVTAGVKPGDEVILPGYAPIPTILPILSVGAVPRFIDTAHIGTLDVDDAVLLGEITRKTRAVIFLPMWGYPPNYRQQVQLLRERGVATIEDACQAHFAVDGDGLIGTLADFGCFSTHDRKILSTGEGGFLLCNADEAAERARLYTRLGGMKGTAYGPNFKLSALQAALGIARLRRVDEQLSIRARNARRVLDAVTGYGWRELEYATGGHPNYYVLVLLASTDDPGQLQRVLMERGLSTDFLNYGPAQYRRELFGTAGLNLPNAVAMQAAAVTVPVHPGISERDVQELCDLLVDVADIFSRR